MATQYLNEGKHTPETKTKDFTEKARDIAGTAATRAKDMAGEAADKAKEFAGDAADKAKELASTVGQKACDATAAVGTGMQSLAHAIRENSPDMLSGASSAVAGAMERGGRYIEDEGLSGMARDVTNLVRRNPIPALLLGIGVGFLIARAIRR